MKLNLKTLTLNSYQPKSQCYWVQLAVMAAQAAASAYSAKQQNKAARAAAGAAHDFSAHMSNTAYQRGMADMKAAGLNPILAYKQGGASTPQGVQAPVVAEGPGVAVSSALQAGQQMAGIQKNQQEVENLKELNEKTIAQTKNEKLRTTLIEMETLLTDWQGVKTRHDSDRIALEIEKQKLALEKFKNLSGMEETTVGEWLRWIDFAGQSINPFASSAQTGQSIYQKGKK